MEFGDIEYAREYIESLGNRGNAFLRAYYNRVTIGTETVLEEISDNEHKLNLSGKCIYNNNQIGMSLQTLVLADDENTSLTLQIKKFEHEYDPNKICIDSKTNILIKSIVDKDLIHLIDEIFNEISAGLDLSQ